MDLRFRNVEPSEAEKRAVDAALGPASSRWEGGEAAPGDDRLARGGREARDRRHLLLPALHAAQARVGWISEGALDYVCRRLTVPPAEAYGVATFYAMFSTTPRPPEVVWVCEDVVCRMRGGREAHDELSRALAGRAGVVVKKAPCLGLCERAPAALVTKAGERPTEAPIAPADRAGVEAALRDATARPPATPRIPQFGEPHLRLLRRVGRVDPASLDDYRAHEGYEALRLATRLGPEGVVREVIDSKLAGRGGAAFPTGKKWESVSKAAVRPHYLVCNADESEPGTFKDRVLMEEDPFAVLESMTIAGYATGCETGFLYVRGEYPLATERLGHAIEAARARGFLGGNVMGMGFRFDVEVRRGAGAYICGEETALFNSLEGKRGEPRSKPPFPTVSGLFGKPTLVNNVETLVNVLDVVLHSGPAYARVGTGRSTGPKLFCVSGRVRTPGLYEVPFGTSLRQLLERAGGVPEGRTLRAVLLGGAAGAFVTPDEIDVPLTFEGTQAIGATLGSGVVVVLDDTTDLWDVILRIAAFFRDESCGQCVPCRVGTVRQEEALHRLARASNGSRAADAALLAEVGHVMKDASICGLGQTAHGAVASAIAKLGLLGRGPA